MQENYNKAKYRKPLKEKQAMEMKLAKGASNQDCGGFFFRLPTVIVSIQTIVIYSIQVTREEHNHPIRSNHPNNNHPSNALTRKRMMKTRTDPRLMIQMNQIQNCVQP